MIREEKIEKVSKALGSLSKEELADFYDDLYGELYSDTLRQYSEEQLEEEIRYIKSFKKED